AVTDLIIWVEACCSSASRHVAYKRGRSTGSTDNKIMHARLVSDRQMDCAHQLSIVRRSASHCLEVDGIFLGETGVQDTRGRNENAIAALTEILCERRYEADRVAGFGHASVARRTTGAQRKAAQRPAAFDRPAQLMQRGIGRCDPRRHR